MPTEKLDEEHYKGYITLDDLALQVLARDGFKVEGDISYVFKFEKSTLTYSIVVLPENIKRGRWKSERIL